MECVVTTLGNCSDDVLHSSMNTTHEDLVTQMNLVCGVEDCDLLGIQDCHEGEDVPTCR